mgnify:CR=1 FL=1
MHIGLLFVLSLYCGSAVDSATETAFVSLLSTVGDTGVVRLYPANVDSAFGCEACFVESTTDASSAYSASRRHFTAGLPGFQDGEAAIVFSEEYSRIRTGWVVEALYIEIPSTDAAKLYERCREMARSRIPQRLWYEGGVPNRVSWYIENYGMVTMRLGPDRKRMLLEVQVNEGMSDGFEP